MAAAQSGLILFAHGARDPSWRSPFETVRQLAQTRLPGVPVKLAFLDLMTPDLATAVGELVHAGCSEITVVPLFLGQGGHVRRDLPALIAQFQRDYPQLAINVVPAAGDDPAVLSAIAQYCIDAFGRE